MIHWHRPRRRDDIYDPFFGDWYPATSYTPNSRLWCRPFPGSRMWHLYWRLRWGLDIVILACLFGVVALVGILGLIPLAWLPCMIYLSCGCVIGQLIAIEQNRRVKEGVDRHG